MNNNQNNMSNNQQPSGKQHSYAQGVSNLMNSGSPSMSSSSNMSNSAGTSGYGG